MVEKDTKIGKGVVTKIDAITARLFIENDKEALEVLFKIFQPFRVMTGLRGRNGKHFIEFNNNHAFKRLIPAIHPRAPRRANRYPPP